MGKRSNAFGSGKEALSPAPPPLRTARAPFDASSSSIEQRPCEIRPGAAPPADDTPSRTRLLPWTGANLSVTTAVPATERTSVAEAAPAKVVATSPTFLRHFLRRFADVSRPTTPEGSLPAFAWGDVAGWLNPYPPYYRAAFASSLLLYPQPHRLALRFAFPCGRATGLPRCAAETRVG